MGVFAPRLKAAIARCLAAWHGRSTLSVLRQRCQDYARIARPLLIYGLGIGFWLADFTAIGHRLWPRLLGLLAGAPPLNTPVCGNAQCDFSMFWPAGLLARAHQFAVLYQSAPFLAFRQHMLTAATQRIDWIYPPPTLLLTMPASMLPFDAGALIWAASLTLASALCLRWARLSWPVIACTLLCPAAMWNYECAQISLFTACLLIAGLLRMGDAPWRAGALLGLLVIKPQLALLLGAAMLATRNWRAILATGTSALAICGLTTLLLGPQVWQAYFTFGAPVAAQVLDAPLLPQTYEAFGISIFWMFRSLGAGLHLASAAQSLSACAAIGLTWCIWRSRAGLVQKLTVTSWATLLATPYGYTYDLIAASAGMAALIEARGWRVALTEPAFWVWPALCPLVTGATGYELTPCITVLALVWYWPTSPRQGTHLDRLAKQAVVLK